MLLKRLGVKMSLPWRYLLAAVMVAVSLGLASAQDEDITTTIDFSDPSLLYERTIPDVPRVPKLGLHIPNGTMITFPLNMDIPGTTCNTRSGCLHPVLTANITNNSLSMDVRRDNIIMSITFIFNDTYTAGCRNFMFPVNATAADSADTLDPVTLICEPVGNVSLSGATIVWQRFTNQTDLDSYIRSCSRPVDRCSESCTGSNPFTVQATDSLLVMGYNLTINNPLSNHAWFVPTFQRDNCTYLAPPTFLYRWPRILTHYEFSLEVQERATNYSGLSCEADAFPPTTTMRWLRAGRDFDQGRYTFTNISNGEQLTIGGGVTISDVMYEDSEVFTCQAGHAASMPNVPDTSLSVRLRVRNRLRPLWPALGIVGVGIVVALFIIIGHFVDKAIEKTQTDPLNPAHHKRLQSITSATLEGENSSNNLVPGKNSSHGKSSGHHGGHGAVKRLSSARLQLLEESQA